MVQARQPAHAFEWSAEETANPVYLREGRRRIMRRGRLWAALATILIAVLAAAPLMGGSEMALMGAAALAIATAALAGLLLVLSFVTDRRLGHLDELQVTRLTMAEIMGGKLTASVLPFVPAVGVGLLFGWVALSIGNGDEYFSLPVLLPLAFAGAVGLWAVAWAVRCSLWATRGDPWICLVVYGAGVVIAVGLPVVLQMLWVRGPQGDLLICAAFGLGYLLLAGLDAAVLWRRIARFGW